MKYILQAVIAESRVGSLEEMIERVAESASSFVGSPVKLIATFSDGRAIGVAAGKSVVIEHVDGSVVSVSDAGLEIEEADLSAEIGAVLADCARAIVSGKPCNRLHEIAGSVRPDGLYLPWQVEEKLVAACSPTWADFYEKNEKEIRGLCRGVLGKLEDSYRVKPFSSASDKKLDESASDIAESLARVGQLCSALAGEAKSLVLGDSTSELVKEVVGSIVSEAETVSAIAPLAVSGIKSAKSLASINDRFVGRLQRMAITIQYMQSIN